MAGAWIYMSLHPDQLWGPPSLLLSRYQGSYLGDKAARALS